MRSARSESKTQWGLNLSGDVMYTKYFDTLFITFRTAVYGARRHRRGVRVMRRPAALPPARASALARRSDRLWPRRALLPIPVHDQEVQALGPENPEIPPAQYHRAGQPCTVCHGPEGPAQTQFSIAGTIFGTPYIEQQANDRLSAGNDANISMIDDFGQRRPAIEQLRRQLLGDPSAFNPAFPILVRSIAGRRQRPDPR